MDVLCKNLLYTYFALSLIPDGSSLSVKFKLPVDSNFQMQKVCFFVVLLFPPGELPFLEIGILYLAGLCVSMSLNIG